MFDHNLTLHQEPGGRGDLELCDIIFSKVNRKLVFDLDSYSPLSTLKHHYKQIIVNIPMYHDIGHHKVQ